MSTNRETMIETLRTLGRLISVCTDDLPDVHFTLILACPGPEGKGADVVMESNLDPENAVKVFRQAADRIESGRAHVQYMDKDKE